MGKISRHMREALVLFEQEQHFGRSRASTVSGLEKRGLLSRTAEGFALTEEGRALVQEQIGVQRPNRNQLRFRDAHHLRPTFDVGQSDYAFWDRARLGQARGLEIAGLFLKPLASKKAAWVIGQAPKVALQDEAAQEYVADWMRVHYASVVQAYEDAVALGDAYLVINPDLSIAVVSPDVVVPVVDDNDYSKQLGWLITQSYPHPVELAQIMVIEDEITIKGRVRRILKNGVLLRTERYSNLLSRLMPGLLPVIHIANNARANEKHGRPEGEALLRLFQRYDEVLAAGVEGNIKQGRPVPVAEMPNAEAVNKLFEMFGKNETIAHPDGTNEQVQYIDFSSDDLVALVGKFYYAQPGSFSKDTEVLLGLMFYLFLQHTEIPEFIWGNAIASSKASAESQMPPFVKWVEKNQGIADSWFLSLVQIIVAYGVLLGEVGRSALKETARITWPALTDQDGRLTLDAIELGLRNQILSDETALALMPLDIDDPSAELERLRVQIEDELEREAERQREQDMLDAFVSEEPADLDEDDETDDVSPNGESDEDEEEPVDEIGPVQAVLAIEQAEQYLVQRELLAEVI